MLWCQIYKRLKPCRTSIMSAGGGLTPGFRSFWAAWRTLLRGLRKGQTCWSAAGGRSVSSTLYCWYVWIGSLIHSLIERLIGTMMGAVHLLPGTTFSDSAQKGAYRSENSAVLTLNELERWLALQIVGVYHQSVHATLGRTPAAVWQEGLARRPRPVREPQDRERFFLDFLPGQRRLIRRDGVWLFHLRYWHDVLSPLAGRSPKPVLIKYDPRNLSQVYWQDEEGQYWKLPYRNLALPPISLWNTMRRCAGCELRASGCPSGAAGRTSRRGDSICRVLSGGGRGEKRKCLTSDE
jgi:hypothetical protein